MIERKKDKHFTNSFQSIKDLLELNLKVENDYTYI